MNDETSRYRLVSTSRITSEVQDIPLSQTEGGERRKVIRVRLVNNPKSSDNTVEFALVAQRRGKSAAEWEDIPGDTLANMKAGDIRKISLDTTETKSLLEHLISLYQIDISEIQSRRVILEVADLDQVIRTDLGRAGVIRQLLQGDHGEEIWNQLSELYPKLADKFSVNRIFEKRQQALQQFEREIGQPHDEQYWQDFLTTNKWIFGSSNIAIIQERRVGIHHTTDIPFEVEGRFVDIVELKRPDIDFWAQMPRAGGNYKYRGKYLIPHYELSGAVAQVAEYILRAEKQLDSLDYRADHGGVIPLKPRGIVVHGRSEGWDEEEWMAYRLMNDELHGIQVITFDILLDRAKRALDSLAGEITSELSPDG